MNTEAANATHLHMLCDMLGAMCEGSACRAAIQTLSALSHTQWFDYVTQ
jgi:hypothetical protein